MTTVRNRTAANPDKENESKTHLADSRPTKSKDPKSREQESTASAATVATAVLSPALITSLVFIFGGCCSNVYVLESILSLSPASGPLVTFLQFLLTTIFTLPSQLTTEKSSAETPSSTPSWRSVVPRLRARNIPLRKWAVYTVMFLTVNMLNNMAFNYRISVPLHIIVRSAGPVSSMLVGYVVAGRRYPFRRIVAVVFLFSGVVMAALSDAASKGKIATTSGVSSSAFTQQLPGFVLLVTALFISAGLGIYTDRMYTQHGRAAGVSNENLFYSHMLSLPYFATQFTGLYSQYTVLVSNATGGSGTSILTASKSNLPDFLQPFASYPPISYLATSDIPVTPILLLFANAVTQIMCISGVNQLATQTTSLTVSVVLNTRKLVSLVLSIWLFGNKLPFGVMVGAALVFLGAGIYSVPSRRPRSDDKKGN